MEIWFAVAASAALFGTLWQCSFEIHQRIRAMNFLKAHNAMLDEELKRIRSAFPFWRPLLRRRLTRRVRSEAFEALNADEKTQARDYDRMALGWSSLVAAALIAAVLAWVQTFNSAA